MKALILLCVIIAFANATNDDSSKHKVFRDWLEKEITESASKLLHLRGLEPLQIPIDIDIVFIGFRGDGAYGYTLDEEHLEDILLDHFDSRRPVDRKTGKELSIDYIVDYHVVDLEETLGENPDSNGTLTELEQTLQKLMKPSERKSLLADSPYVQAGYIDWKTYSIEATELEPTLDTLVQKVLETKEITHGAPQWFDRNVIVVLNPSKRRMQPAEMLKVDDSFKDADVFDLKLWDNAEFKVESVMKEEAGFGYFYTYQQNGMSTSWISHSNYMVIDITAGPVKFGAEMTPSGDVSPSVLPRLMDVLYEGTTPFALHGFENRSPGFVEHVADVRDTLFRGKIASTIVSALNHVFLNDIYIDNTLDSRKIMAPLIVLRNHADFSPFGDKDDPHVINGSAIEQQLETLTGRNRVIVTESLHSLHQHKALAVALFKSMVAKSEAVVLPKPGTQIMYSRIRYYLDADVLLREFAMAADTLSAAWIRDGTSDPDNSNERIAANRARLVRTVPVFILSLKDVAFDLTFQNNELVVTNGQVVIVLQTIGVFDDQLIDAKYTGHYVGWEPVLMSTVDVERHVLAGLTTALTGTPPPYEMYHKARNEVFSQWMWSTGHMPFGPHSISKSLSILAKHTALRNSLVGRLEKLLRTLRESVETVDAFVAKYSSAFAPADDQSRQLKRDSSWIDFLYKRPTDFIEPPLPAEVVQVLEDQMKKIEATLITLSHEFFQADFNGADKTLRLLGQAVQSFSTRIRNELTKAENRLQCCRIEYKVPESKRINWKMYLVVGIVALVLITAYTFIPVVETYEPLLRR